MKIKKRVVFCAAHSIKDAGKCSNIHGHNWEANIEVELVHGDLDNSGFIADVAKIKAAAFKYDHGNLNDFFGPMGIEPSTENVAQEIAWDAMEVVMQTNPKAQVKVTVHLIETENNSAVAVASNVKAERAPLWTPKES